MSADIASKLAGVKVKISSKKKYKTYMPYMGNNANPNQSIGSPMKDLR